MSFLFVGFTIFGGACSRAPSTPSSPASVERAPLGALASASPTALAAPADATVQVITTPVDLALVGIPLPGTDVCDKNSDGSIKDEIPTGRYQGLLRNARCDQQKFLTMASVMKQLGVTECTYCHAPDPTNPKKALYTESTPRKEIANWMLSTFVDGLRRVDGNPMTCRSCHTSEKGKGHGAPHFLKEPRDVAFTQEWMNEVMTTQFSDRAGERLRCKTCHEGMAPSRAGWNPHVIRQLVLLPNGRVTRRVGGL